MNCPPHSSSLLLSLQYRPLRYPEDTPSLFSLRSLHSLIQYLMNCSCLEGATAWGVIWMPLSPHPPSILPFLRSHLHFHYTEMPLTSFSCPFPSHFHLIYPRKTTVCIVTNGSTVVLFPSKEDKLDIRKIHHAVFSSNSIITLWSLFNPWYSTWILSISINLSLEGHSHPYRFSQCTKPRESYYVSSTLFPLFLFSFALSLLQARSYFYCNHLSLCSIFLSLNDFTKQQNFWTIW